MKEIEERLKLFFAMLSSVSNVAFAEYDDNYQIVETNDSEYHKVYQNIFFPDLIRELDSYHAENYLKSKKNRPVIYKNYWEMAYIASWLMEKGKTKRIYIIGPVFLDDYSVAQMNRKFYSEANDADRMVNFRKMVTGLPQILLSNILEYGIMLHYAVTGEHITSGDFIIYRENINPGSGKDSDNSRKYSSRGAYMAEQRFLKMVEEGNLDYKKEENQLGKFDQSILFPGDFLQQKKLAIVVFSTLCSRAAIKGGLDSETAFKLNDRYIQAAMSALNMDMLYDIKEAMVYDFIMRVHRIRYNCDISPQILSSCDYISTHLDEVVDIHTLAERLGYTDYYFSSKFKKEIGMSVRDYVMDQKVERAKQMLADSNEDLLSISIRLGFSSQSHFGRIFKKKTGMSPSEYRKRAALS